MEAEASFPALLVSAGDARRFAERTLRTWGGHGPLIGPDTGGTDSGGDEHLIDSVRLLVSELIVNAVLHAETSAVLRMRLSEDCLRVEVRDGSTRPLCRREYEPNATAGRGLMILDAIADSWGVERAGQGKTVWFELTRSAI
jgi:Histidine kinase-like ATPase domain